VYFGKAEADESGIGGIGAYYPSLELKSSELLV
jgi:hypothetical protein